MQAMVEHVQEAIARAESAYDLISELYGNFVQEEAEARAFAAGEFVFAGREQLRKLLEVITSEQPSALTEAERNQIAAYARHLTLRDTMRFTDAQLYNYFCYAIDVMIRDEEKATNTHLDDHASLTHLMYDFVTSSLDSDPEDTDEWLIKYTYASEFAQIIRATLG